MAGAPSPGRALVTGGAGFIGSHLVERLLAEGYRVRVLDNLSTGHRENLAGLAGPLDFQQGDILDRELLGRLCNGVELVFHQAALPSVTRSLADPRQTHEQLASGTLNVLLAARDGGARRLIYGASSSAYGDAAGRRKAESQSPQPISPYAAAKLAGEYYCQVFARVYGLETVSLRYFNVFGPRQDPHSEYAAVIPRFIQAMRAGQRPTIFGDGRQSRDFTYVANVIDGNLLAAHADSQAANFCGRTLNIAGGQRYDLLELVAQLNELLGTALAPLHTDERPGDIRHSLADIQEAERLLGYRPRVGFAEGLRRTAAWFARQPA